MRTYIRKAIRVFITKPLSKIRSVANKSGVKHKCNICGNTFNKFIKYHGGNKNIPEFRKKLNLVDSDRDNFGCPYCPSYDRERHLFMFFDKIKFWDEIPKLKILHFAPEKNLSKKIRELEPRKYVEADFCPNRESIKKIDATDIPYNNDLFDLVICNHVLEHIPEYFKAMSEIHRVLKPNGMAILQTPYSKVLSKNFEDKNIDTDDKRLFFYGEKDHYRIFSEQQFLDDLKKVGFILDLINSRDFFDDQTSSYFGFSNNEDLIRVVKKGTS